MSHHVTDHVPGTLSELDRTAVAAVPSGGNWRDLPGDFPSARVRQIRDGAAAGTGSRSTYYGRLRWDRPSYTISTYITRPGNGCHIHPEHDRLITVREAARLQTFPDFVQFSGTLRARAVQVGNAVPPLLARAVGGTLPAGTVVDLFSGVGGMSIGLGMSGHDIVAEVDNDRHAVAAAQVRAGDRAVLADLSDPDTVADLSREVLRRHGRPDTVVGGPPCQGLSTAGNCDLSDPRNRLVLSFVDAVQRLRPRNVVMENVPALLFRGAHLLDEARRLLEALGYRTSVAVLHAEGYGVPQLRRRLFLQGRSDGDPVWPVPSRRVLDPSHLRWQPGHGTGGADPVDVRSAIGDLPAAAGEHLDDGVPVGSPRTPFQRWSRGELGADVLEGPVQSAMGTEALLFSVI